MKDWPDKCVDLVLTDPPYGIGFSEYDKYKDDTVNYNKWIWSACAKIESFISNGWMCVFQAAKKCREWHKIFPRPYRLLAFPKTFVHIFKVHGPTWATDYALLWEVGEAKQRGKLRDWMVSDTANMKYLRGHPCPRPIQQMLYCVEMLSEKDDLILDPFCGSGTTCVAAKMLGRKYIGIDISEKYCEIARQRLKAIDTGISVAEQRAGQKGLFE